MIERLLVSVFYIYYCNYTAVWYCVADGGTVRGSQDEGNLLQSPGAVTFEQLVR